MRKWIPVVLILVAVIASVVIYPGLPERIPTHWNLSGQSDEWSSRLWGAWIMPLTMALIWLIMRAIPHVDPRRGNYAKFSGVYETLVIAILAFMLGIHALLLTTASGTPVAMGRIVMAGAGVFIIVMGALLPRIYPNWFIGIRTPWTLSSDVSWDRTHKVGGMVFMLVGALTLLSAAVIPAAAVWVVTVSAIGAVIYLFAYSYIAWKKDPSRRTGRLQ